MHGQETIIFLGLCNADKLTISVHTDGQTTSVSTFLTSHSTFNGDVTEFIFTASVNTSVINGSTEETLTARTATIYNIHGECNCIEII